jgi:hypothetical protein
MFTWHPKVPCRHYERILFGRRHSEKNLSTLLQRFSSCDISTPGGNKVAC